MPKVSLLHRPLPIGALLAQLALTACTGEITSPNVPDPAAGGSTHAAGGSGPAGPITSEGIHTEEARTACAGQPRASVRPLMRRLSRREYNNTVLDLLQDDRQPANGWLAERSGAAFDNDGFVQVLNRQHVEQFRLTAMDVAANAISSRLDQLAPCAGAEPSACARQFITDFGKRAYRRPLSSAEVSALETVYAVGAEKSYSMGVQLVLETMLQNPPFLYLASTGTGTDGAAAPAGFEVASRLSYFLWSTTPDTELLTAAEAGVLASPEGVLQQATRLLDSPRARGSIEHFYSQWLDVDTLPGQTRSPAFPPFGPDAINSLLRGFGEFVTRATLGGSYQQLMSSPTFYADAATASLLGLAPPAAGVLGEFTAPAGQRSGVLTEPAFVAAHAQYDGHSPIHRGVFVRESVLCSPPPPPPAGLVITSPAVDPTLTTRERFSQHRENPTCAGCHAYFDELGLGFENYDAVGRYRTEENGKPIDSSGRLVAYDEQDRSFNDAAGLAQIVSESPEASACFLKHWYRFANGRPEAEAEVCGLVDLYQTFQSKSFSIRDLLLQIAVSPAFLTQPEPASEECAPW